MEAVLLVIVASIPAFCAGYLFGVQGSIVISLDIGEEEE